MTGRYNAYTGNRPLKWQISVPKSSFELFGRNRFWWVTCVLSYTLWDLGVSIAPPHPSALAIEWLAVLTAPKSLSYCTTFPTLTVYTGRSPCHCHAHALSLSPDVVGGFG